MTAAGDEEKSSLIQSLNCNMQCFMEELRYFRLKYNVVNKSLLQNMFKVVGEVNEFLECNPEEIQENSTELDLSFLQYKDNILNCSLCKVNFENNALLHLIGWTHKTRLNSAQQQIKEAIQVLQQEKVNKAPPVGDTKEKKEIIKLQIQQKTFSQKIIKDLDVPRIFKTKNSGESYVESMLTETNNASFYSDLVDKFQERIEKFHLYLCGPLAFGLQNFYSTQEFFVDTGDAFYAYPSKAIADLKNSIKTIVATLFVNQNGLKEWEYSIDDKSADAPILRLCRRNQQIKCIFTFANGLPYCKGLIVKKLISLNTLYSKTCIVLQKIVKDFNLDEYFDAYIIVLLVIFYYQTREILPPIHLLQQKSNSAYSIGPWQVNFNQDVPKKFLSKNRSIGSPNHFDHIRKCLRFLANQISFDKKISIMSPFLGPIEVKTDNFHSYLLKNPLTKRYLLFCESTTSSEYLKATNPGGLCLQDPIELNKNLTGHIPNDALKYLQSIILKIIK